MWFACCMHSGAEAEECKGFKLYELYILIGKKWFFRVYVSCWIPWRKTFTTLLKHQLFWSYLDMELMKEKFAKLLLGEDMSGGGKGVSSALALSNAITNLAGNHQYITKTCCLLLIWEVNFSYQCLVCAASVFGEMKRLEPMPAERKAKWRKEIGWLLSVTDHIVEFVPCKQISKAGINMEVPYLSPSNFFVAYFIYLPYNKSDRSDVHFSIRLWWQSSGQIFKWTSQHYAS